MNIEELEIQAINKIDYEMVTNIEKGETIQINKGFSLYNYEDSEFCVLINEENSEEIYCVLLDHKNKDLIFESLI